MRKNKKNIAFAILVGFLLALTPRSFFHDCHQHVESIGKEKSKQCIDQKECDFCSYDIGDIACSHSFQFDSYKTLPFISPGLPVISRASSFSLILFFRGPPVC